MDTWIEKRADRMWQVVADDDPERILALIHEGNDRRENFEVLPRGSDPSLLADLQGRRYSSLDSLACAVGDHLEGKCHIR